VKAIFFVAAGITAACATAHAQTVTPPQPPAQTAAAPAGAAAPRVPPPPEARRRDITYMEGILTQAVRAGAAELGQRMQIAEPGSVIVTGTARARGIALEGYGVLFDVDVPMMKQSVIWTTRQLIQQDLRDKIQALNQIIARTNDPDDLRRAQAQQRFFMNQLNSVTAGSAPRTLSTENGAAGTAVASPVANAGVPPPGVAAAATVNESITPATTLDPNELYTDAVKRALIDAMLNYSVALKLADDEWLTVAARDNEGPLTPGALDDASTIVIRVKGVDLAAFHSNKLTREEVLKKVEIREF
jgi:hypothetical protein